MNIYNPIQDIDLRLRLISLGNFMIKKKHLYTWLTHYN